MRKPDDGADADRGAGEDGAGERHGVRLDAGRGDGGVEAEGEASAEVGVGEGWVEEGVVDGLGEMREGDFDCGGGGDHGWAGDGDFDARRSRMGGGCNITIAGGKILCARYGHG